MKLSVIISNRNDTKMLSVTVRSCIEALKPLGLPNCEIVIADNSDEEIFDSLFKFIPYRYVNEGVVKLIRQPFSCLFTARETAAEAAQSDLISCIDSHMLIGRDMFLDLYEYMDFYKDDPTIGFVHAPISWIHRHESSSRHDRDISENELGPWGVSYKKPTTITWKGMPWICRKRFFLSREDGIGGYGALAQYKISWGGGDMHIGTKPWLLGFRNIAIPTDPGIHIGPFPDERITPNIVKSGTNFYRLYTSSGVGPNAFGYLISCYVLGGMPMIKRNREVIIDRFGKFIDVDKWTPLAVEYGEEEKAWLDSKKIMTFEQMLERKPWND